MSVINENAARIAHEMTSFSDYKPGSATAGYNAQVEEAHKELERVRALCHTEQQRERAEALFIRYCSTLATAINRDNEIGTRCPSVMVCGAGNFPTRKKQKQIAAWEANQTNFEKAEHYLSLLSNAHCQNVKSTDPEVLPYLYEKLAKLEVAHEIMRLSNEYWRKNNKQLDGCPYLSQKAIDEVKNSISQGLQRQDLPPFLSWQLQNSSANIKRIQKRIEKIETLQSTASVEVEHETYAYKENHEIMRIQFFFDDKPDDDTRNLLKKWSFNWSHKNGAWQRQLTENGKWAAREVMKALDAAATK